MNSGQKITLPGKVNRVNVRQHFSLKVFRQAAHGAHHFYLCRQLRSAALALPKQFLR
jgi:hypothetical protein